MDSAIFVRQMHERVGFTPLYDCLGAPHWNDAKDLQQIVKSYDPNLEVGYCYQPHDQRENRWAIRWVHPTNGSQQLAKKIEWDDGSYRPPGAWVLSELQRDKIRNPHQIIKEMDQAEASQQKRRDELREQTKETIKEGLRREFVDRGNRHILDPLKVGF